MKATRQLVIVILCIFGITMSLFAAEIHEAVEKGDLELVTKIITENPDELESQGEEQDTALQCAANAVNLEISDL
jgi:ankyrin repeat protein